MDLHALQSQIARLTLDEQLNMLSSLEQSISEHLGYEDKNIKVAEENLRRFQAGDMHATNWHDVKKRIFDA